MSHQLLCEKSPSTQSKWHCSYGALQTFHANHFLGNFDGTFFQRKSNTRNPTQAELLVVVTWRLSTFSLAVVKQVFNFLRSLQSTYIIVCFLLRILSSCFKWYSAMKYCNDSWIWWIDNKNNIFRTGGVEIFAVLATKLCNRITWAPYDFPYGDWNAHLTSITAV